MKHYDESTKTFRKSGVTSRHVAFKLDRPHEEIVACIDRLIPHLQEMLTSDRIVPGGKQRPYSPGNLIAALDIEKAEDPDGVYYAALSNSMVILIAASFINETNYAIDLLCTAMLHYFVDSTREKTASEWQVLDGNHERTLISSYVPNEYRNDPADATSIRVDVDDPNNVFVQTLEEQRAKNNVCRNSSGQLDFSPNTY